MMKRNLQRILFSMLFMCMIMTAHTCFAQKVETTYWQTFHNGSIVNTHLKSRITMLDNGVVIKAEHWWSNGKLAMSMSYDSDGELHGTAVEYDELGRLLVKQQFNHGVELYVERYRVDGNKYQCYLKEKYRLNDDNTRTLIEAYELVGKYDTITGEDFRTFMQTVGQLADGTVWLIDKHSKAYTEQVSTSAYDKSSTTWTDNTKKHKVKWSYSNDDYAYTAMTLTKLSPDMTFVIDDRLCYESYVYKSLRNNNVRATNVTHYYDNNEHNVDTTYLDSNNREFRYKLLHDSLLRVYNVNTLHASVETDDGIVLYKTSLDNIEASLNLQPITKVFKNSTELQTKYGVHYFVNELNPYAALVATKDDIFVLSDKIKVTEQQQLTTELSAKHPAYQFSANRTAIIASYIDKLTKDNAVQVDSNMLTVIDAFKSYLTLLKYDSTTGSFVMPTIEGLLPSTHTMPTCTVIDDGSTVTYYATAFAHNIDNSTTAFTYDDTKCICLNAYKAMKTFFEQHKQFVMSSNNKKLIKAFYKNWSK